MNRPKNDSVVRLKIVGRNTQSSASMYVGETLPIDLIIEILSRLPAKSIAICRCVSKQWSSLLRRQDFTESFLTSSLSRPRLLFTVRFSSELHFFSSPQPQKFGENLSVVVRDYHTGYSRDKIYIDSCQSVHGFISLNDWVRGKKERVHIICNPCTGQHITLPQLMNVGNVESKSFLGYDPIQKQFNVLCRTLFRRPQTTSNGYQVLTLGTGELLWRKIECWFPHFMQKMRNGICINGVLYYVAWIQNSYNIAWITVCFDVRSEKFSFIEIEKARLLTHVNYKGKLGVLLCFDYSGVAEVWVLEDTKKVKWSKHIFVMPNWEAVNSMWATDTGEIVWASSRWTHPFYVFYYNLERQSVRRVEIKGIEDTLSTDRVCHEASFTFTNYVENVMILK